MTSAILSGITLHYGHYIFIAVAALLVAAVTAVIVVTQKKRKKAIRPNDTEPFYDEVFPPMPDPFSFLRDMGFDPYREPEIKLDGDQDFSGNETVSEELAELLTRWYGVIALQETYRRQMTALNNRHNLASDCIAFLDYLQRKSEQYAASIKAGDEKNGTGQRAVIQKMDARCGEIRESYKSHSQEIWAAVENLRSRIIANDAELFSLKAELEVQRRRSADVPVEVSRALRQFDITMRYEALIPLLHAINRAFSESETAQGILKLTESKRNQYAVRLEGVEKQLKERKDAQGCEHLKSTAEWLTVAVKLFDAVIGAYIAHRKTLADDYLIHKKAADDYLGGQRFSVDEIVSNEDRVIGQIAYESARRNILSRQRTAGESYTKAEDAYGLAMRERRFLTRKQGQERQEQEKKIEAAAAALKAARANKAAADEDVETELPRLNPITLIKSGSGIISQEYLSALDAKGGGSRTFKGYIDDVYRIVRAYQSEGEILYTRDPQDYFDESGVPAPVVEAEPEPVTEADLEEQYPLNGTVLSERLDALVKRTAGTADPGGEKPRGKALAESPETIEKVNKRIAEIMRLRRQLKYIDNARETKAFNAKLNQLVKSLDEDEKNNVALTELIKRTKSMAVYLGKKGTTE